MNKERDVYSTVMWCALESNISDEGPESQAIWASGH